MKHYDMLPERELQSPKPQIVRSSLTSIKVYLEDSIVI